MSYRNKTTGELISDEQYQTRFGVQSSPLTPEIPLQEGNFMQRLKLGFGGSEATQKQHEIESLAGLRGKLDIGDIADVAGATLPILGGIAGAPLGGLPGTAVGAAFGQGARRVLGGLIGADQPTGGELAKDVALTGIGTFVGGKILGGLFNVISKTIPNKLISTIFKQSADDISKEVKSGGKNLVQSQQILNEGLRGDSRKMMETSLNIMKDLEVQAHGAVAGQKVTIPNVRGYINLISDYLKNLKATSYGFETSIANEGKQIVIALQKSRGGTISAELALQTRRFIDGVRRTSSFKLNPNLSPKEAAYKKSADLLRITLADQIPIIGPLMRRYTIYINAFEDLAKYAAKTQNKDVFDLIDVFIMYGINPTAYLARRGLSSAFLKTNLAQGLSRGGRLVEQFLPSGGVAPAITQGIRSIFRGTKDEQQ